MMEDKGMGLCGSWVKSKVNGGVWKVMCGGENLEKKNIYIYIYYYVDILF